MVLGTNSFLPSSWSIKPFLQIGNFSNYIRNTSCNERHKYLDIPHIPNTISKLYGTIFAKLCYLGPGCQF
jgi:hypothetical protein